MGVFMGREVFSVTEQLRNLRRRAGLSIDEMAHVLGDHRRPDDKRNENSANYEDGEEWSKDYFSVELTQKIANALIGLGQPAIKPDEVWALGLPEARLRLLVKQQDAYNESVTVRIPPEVVTGQLAANIMGGIEEIGRQTNETLSEEKPANEQFNKYLEDLTDETSNVRVKNSHNVENNRLLPVYGHNKSGENDEFELAGNVVFDVSCPPQLYQSRDAYAVEVSGKSMWPRYRDGEIVYCDPTRQVKKGDFVLAQVKIDDNKPPQAFVKMFLEHNSDELVLEQLNPPKKLVFANDKVVCVHYIALSGDAL